MTEEGPYCYPGGKAESKTEGAGEGWRDHRASIPPAQAIRQPTSQDLRPPEDPQGRSSSQTHCLMHWGPFLPALQAHHLSHLSLGRQDGLTCEELQAFCGGDVRPEGRGGRDAGQL